MKEKITYHQHPSGEPFEVEYDTDAPCHWCGLPVIGASMGGTACCPWCDMGRCRYDASHRVDGEGFNPATGKLFPSRTHYERWHGALLRDVEAAYRYMESPIENLDRRPPSVA